MKYWKYILLFIGTLTIVLLNSCEETDKPAPEQTESTEQVISNPQLEQVDSLLALEPDNADLYYFKGKILYQMAEFNAAMQNVEKAIELNSLLGKYYILKSDIYFNQKDIVRSILTLEEGAYKDPTNTELLLTLALYYYYTGENEKSIKVADNVLMQDPTVADAYFQKALIFAEIGDTAKAISNLQTTVEWDPEFADAYLELGNLTSSQGDPLSIQYFNNVLTLDSTSMEARYGIAKYHQDRKDYPKAMELFREMILMAPSYEKAYYNMGWMYFQMDSLKKAADNFEIATNLEPAYLEAYYMRGLIAEAQGNIIDAERFYGQTLKLDAEYAPAIQGFVRLKEYKK